MGMTASSPNDVVDRLAIADLVNRSVAGVMRRDAAMWGATWAPDASWKIDLLPEPARGRDVIVGIFAQIMQKFQFVSMSSFVTSLEIRGDRATGEAYSQELLFPLDGGQKILVGCFKDEYVRIDGQWHFQSRVYETLYRSTIIEPSG